MFHFFLLFDDLNFLLIVICTKKMFLKEVIICNFFIHPYNVLANFACLINFDWCFFSVHSMYLMLIKIMMQLELRKDGIWKKIRSHFTLEIICSLNYFTLHMKYSLHLKISLFLCVKTLFFENTKLNLLK